MAPFQHKCLVKVKHLNFTAKSMVDIWPCKCNKIIQVQHFSYQLMSLIIAVCSHHQLCPALLAVLCTKGDYTLWSLIPLWHNGLFQSSPIHTCNQPKIRIETCVIFPEFRLNGLFAGISSCLCDPSPWKRTVAELWTKLPKPQQPQQEQPPETCDCVQCPTQWTPFSWSMICSRNTVRFNLASPCLRWHKIQHNTTNYWIPWTSSASCESKLRKSGAAGLHMHNTG